MGKKNEIPKLEVDFSELKEVLDNLTREVEEKRNKKDWIFDLIIIRESNGYMLDGASDGNSRIRTVIEDDEMDELKSHERLLLEVMEYFGFQGSRHDKERIKIIREKGDKYNG